MPTRPLSDELALETVQVWRQHRRSRSDAAKELGISKAGIDHRLQIAAERGLLLDEAPAMPGFRISRLADGPKGRSIEQKPAHGNTFAVPAGHRIKGVSALIDPDGREVAKWVKTRENDLDPREIAAWLRDAFTGVPPASPVSPPDHVSTDLLTLFPFGDWHLGMFAWGKEVGENWDLKIAERVLSEAVDEVMARAPQSGTAVILFGGDLLHADNKENETARSGNRLDVDGRYPKIVQTAGRIAVRTGDRALEHNDRVIFRVLPGNHDEHSAIAIAYFLLAWYRNEPRVTVDVDPSLFWYFRFGKVMLAATHGHEARITDMPGIMASRRPEDWGATRYRYAHGFHLHHREKSANESGGVSCEVHQAPVPQDAWNFGRGFLSGRSMQAVTYHAEFGEVGRVRVAIMDGGNG